MKIDNVSFLRRVIAVDAIVTGTMALLIRLRRPTAEPAPRAVDFTVEYRRFAVAAVCRVGGLACAASKPTKKNGVGTHRQQCGMVCR